MPIDPSARRFYVITTFGEVGPVGAHELPELVGQGRIQVADMVRSATGRPLGTVADVLEGRVLSSAAVMGAGGTGEAPRRRPQSDRHPSVPPASRPSTQTGLLAGAGILLVVVLLVAMNAGDGGHVKAAAISDGDLPELILVLGREDGSGNREIMVRAAIPPGQDVDVRVERTDGAAGVRLDPPGGIVSLRAGTAAVGLWLRPVEGTVAQPAGLRLAPGGGYRIGTPGDLAVTVTARRPSEPQSTPVVAAVTPPSSAAGPRRSRGLMPAIAWEPCNRMDGAWTGSGNGWAGSWLGSGWSWLPASAETLPGDGFLRFSEPQDSKLRIMRPLARRIADGIVWISLFARAHVSAGQQGDLAGLRLTDGKQVRIGIGWNDSGTGGQPGTWFVYPTMLPEAERGRNRIAIPCDPGVFHRVVVKLTLSGSASSWRLWLDPPPGREPERDGGQSRRDMPSFAFDMVQLYGVRGSGLDLAEVRIGRSWEEVLPPPVP